VPSGSLPSEGGAVLDDVDAVIAACDAVFVCTWTAAHLEEVDRLCAAGVPVFCEKPLSTELATAEELVAVRSRRARVPNMVGLVLRSSPALPRCASSCGSWGRAG
jgi:myo-inositol 2-dehydrogenase / D-chiro-inositol 1-dehydrogenase